MKKVDLRDKSLKQLRGRVALYEKKLESALKLKNRPDNIQKHKVKSYRAEIIRVNATLEQNKRVTADIRAEKDCVKQAHLVKLETKLISDRLSKQPVE